MWKGKYVFAIWYHNENVLLPFRDNAGYMGYVFEYIVWANIALWSDDDGDRAKNCNKSFLPL